MDLQHFTGEENATYARVEADGTVEHVVDLGSAATDATVDVVDGTVIVVLTDDLGGHTQHEIDIPATDPEAFIRNGVLTIRTEDTA